MFDREELDEILAEARRQDPQLARDMEFLSGILNEVMDDDDMWHNTAMQLLIDIVSPAVVVALTAGGPDELPNRLCKLIELWFLAGYVAGEHFEPIQKCKCKSIDPRMN